MKENKKYYVPVLCLCLLLILCLSAGILAVSYGDVSIVPIQADNVSSALPATEASYWLRVEMDSGKLYQMALQQTVHIFWKEYDTEGDLTDSSSASGIILSQDGYILTNAHCVSSALAHGDKMQVEMSDGTIYEGTIIGADTVTDVALMKIEATGLNAATVGSSKRLQGCDTIFAVGNPGDDMKFTVTSGIVSGLDRDITFSDGTTLHMFQIDAAVNPGNSGGPVYDIYGRVVGMVTAKYLDLTTEGIGFAIPIDDAVAIAGELKEHGYVPGRPLLGITVQNIAENYIIKGSPAGVIIFSVEEGLAGDMAGLRRTDIIVSIDGKAITSLEELTAVKRDYRAGDTVTVRFWRGGEFMETQMTFDEVTPEHAVGSVTIDEEEQTRFQEEITGGREDEETEAAEETEETEPEEETGAEEG